MERLEKWICESSFKHLVHMAVCRDVFQIDYVIMLLLILLVNRILPTVFWKISIPQMQFK